VFYFLRTDWSNKANRIQKKIWIRRLVDKSLLEIDFQAFLDLIKNDLKPYIFKKLFKYLLKIKKKNGIFDYKWPTTNSEVFSELMYHISRSIGTLEIKNF